MPAPAGIQKGMFHAAQPTSDRISGRLRDVPMKFGIVIYEDVEPIDLATFGVLSMARRIKSQIEICTIAASSALAPPASLIVNLANGLKLLADHDLGSAPPVDVLVVTGGPGWKTQTQNQALIDFLRRRIADTLMVSVCTGAMILAAAGVLDGRQATTKREVVTPEEPPIERLRADYPAVATCAASLVDSEQVITGGGVSLCIDTMLHLLQKLFGAEMADETARIIEYHRAWTANREQFPPVRTANP
jgi:transcriptional regulator GlxA family with amidase domain